MITRAVVTGPTGAVGTALVQALLDEGCTVYAVVRPGSSRIPDIPQGARIIACDLSEYQQLHEKIPESVDAFFHLGWSGTIGPERNDMHRQTQNIEAALQAVECAARLKANVFVGAGSQAEYGPREGLLAADTPCFPHTGYGMGKLCAGQMTRVLCAQKGIRHIWARLLSVYGPHDNPRSVLPMLIQALLRREAFPLTAGEQQWDYLFSFDAAKALIALAEKGRHGETYMLGSGETHSLAWYFTGVRDAIDPCLPLGLGEVPYPPGQMMDLHADIRPLLRDTGWQATTPFSEGIRITVEAYRARMQ